MIIASFSVTALVATLLTHSAHAGFPDEDDGSTSRHLVSSRVRRAKGAKGAKGGKPAPAEKVNPEEEVDVIIKYTKEGWGENIFQKNGQGRIISEGSRLKVAHTKRSKLAELENDPLIESVELDSMVYALPYIRGNDEDAEGGRRLAEVTPYGISLTKADQLEQGTHQIKICVIDTGYDNSHEDLPDLDISLDGFVPSDNLSQKWYVDGDGHGTHCAGTIGAIGGNNVGITSVNPNYEKFSFFIGKGLDDSGRGSTSGVLEAVTACKDAGAKVISMSLGGGDYSNSAKTLYENTYNDDGVLIIAAAGNDGNNNKEYPASYPHVMSVAAVNRYKSRASFSQINDQVEIAAPGVNVRSTIPGGYRSWSGTSMATPHVAGVAALVWSHFPKCTNKDIRAALLATAEDLGNSGCDQYYGFGLIDAKAAYDFILEQGSCATPISEAEGVGGCSQCDPHMCPTPAPTPFDVCDSDENEFELSLLTDYYGYETSWSVKRSSTVILSGGGYASASQYTERKCIPNNACIFEIADSYGDGICCGHGTGSYQIKVNSRVLKTGGDFDFSDTVNLCPTSMQTVGETGRKRLSNTVDKKHVATISFKNDYINPVVVAFINTRNGGQSVSARIRNLSSSGCQLFMQEPDNQGHMAEWVSYIVVESGRYILEGDVVVEAGITRTTTIHSSGTGWGGVDVQFNKAFSSTPAILHSLVTHDNNDFMASLVTDVETGSFKVGMEAAGSGKTSPGEDVGWIAFSPKTGSTSSTSFVIGIGKDGTADGVSNETPHVINMSGFGSTPDVVVSIFNPVGGDGSWARGAGMWNTAEQRVYAEEDQVADLETGHMDEWFAWAAFSEGTDLLGAATV